MGEPMTEQELRELLKKKSRRPSIQEQVAAVVRDTLADAEALLERWRSYEEGQEQ
jgi:hypothetical protein